MSAAMVIDALPVEAAVEGPRPSMFELILRRQRLLDRLLRDEGNLPSSIQQLVTLSVLGLGAYGAVLGGGAWLLGAKLSGTYWGQGHAPIWMPLALVGALLGAIGLCLPSFYFYTQLSGLDASFRLVTAQALRGVATTAVLLLGAAPFYAAWLLANAVGISDAPDAAIAFGTVLPFAVGLVGIGAVERAFRSMLDVLPVTHQRRGDFVRRMVLAWGALFSAIAPVALYRLGAWFGSFL